MSETYSYDGDVLNLTQDDSDSDGASGCRMSRGSLDCDALFDQIASSVANLQKKDSVSTDSGASTLSEKSEGGIIRKRNALRTRRRSVGSIEDKAKKKTNAALEREGKKQKLAEEKPTRQTASELSKIYKPGECMKYMCVEMHSSLSEAWYCADVQREITAAGAKLTLDDNLCDPALVMWARIVDKKICATEQRGLTSGRECIPRALYVMPAEVAAEHVRARELAPFVAGVAAMAGCTLTLAIFGVKDYFRTSNRKTNNSNKNLMTEVELELAITDLLVSADCDTVIVNTPNDLALIIVQFTKAIAEDPYKKAKHACEEQAEFYMSGDNKKCVSVDKDGHGLSRLWQQMIAVLPSSSLETSRAICGQYKSPLQLFEALQSSDGVQELADVGVARAAMPGARKRRVGPEFARKLRTLLTAEDGGVIID